MHRLYKFSLIYKIQSEERLVNLVRGRECFVGLSKLLVDDVTGVLWKICTSIMQDIVGEGTNFPENVIFFKHSRVQLTVHIQYTYVIIIFI